ncbi:TIGR02452 family protein [Collinsella sp. An271]|uniref:TIGR02452 family protein n=1 Tax=Collinsella sp. An271 TaxID=1965616 RepID=UPI000B36D72A|nr:TIGR02452 family protein [Collinsella sp. An271]MBM6776078.1 TIGR02452 family protein [Collinsella tanakaei]OUO58968.1 TIGR02452 family protein [Collinsella sp. An271]
MAERRENPRKAARADAAKKHIEQMAARYAKEIEQAQQGTVRYDGVPAHEVEEGRVPQVSVVDADAVAVILENGRGRAAFCDLAVLDFASFVNPAGGFSRGAAGQEQSLCRESYLGNVLETFGDWYAENRRRNLNCELYRNRALVVPAVRFGRGKIHAYADVVVAAAPNARRARSEYKVSDEVLADAMRDRIRFVLDLIDARGIKKAVLGAYGCGAFGWDASAVAEMFRAELASGAHALEEVWFAIPKTRYDDNLPRFEHAFACFPEQNGESYSDMQAARAKAAADAAAEAAAEEEDDWRKYL